MLKVWQPLILLLLATFAAPLPAADESPDFWVARLGHPQYVQRNRAFLQLQQLGPQASAAVTKGCQSPDLEIRRRCQQLRDLLTLSARDREDIDFLAGKTLAKAPYWKSWKKCEPQLGGDCFGARHFFLNLYKAEPKLLNAFPTDEKALAALHQKALSRMQHALSDSTEDVQKLPVGPILAFLFLETFQKRSIENQPIHWLGNENLLGFLRNDPGCRHLVEQRLRTQTLSVSNITNIATVVGGLGLFEYRNTELQPWLKKSMRQAMAEIPEPLPVDHLVVLHMAARHSHCEDWALEHFKPYLSRRVRACFHESDFGNYNGALLDALFQLDWREEFSGEIHHLIERLIFRPPSGLLGNDALCVAHQLVQFFDWPDEWKHLVRAKSFAEIEASVRMPLDVPRFERALQLAAQMEMQSWRDEHLLPALRIQLHSPHFRPGTEDAQTLISVALQAEMGDDVKLLVEPHVRKMIASGEYANRLPHLVGDLQNRGELWTKHFEPAVKAILRKRLSEPMKEKDQLEFAALMNHLNWGDFAPTMLEILQKAPERSPLLVQSLFFLVRTGTLQKHQDSLLANATKLGPLVEVRDVVLFHAVSARAENPNDYFFTNDTGVIWSGDAELYGKACLIRAEDRDKAFRKWREFQQSVTPPPAGLNPLPRRPREK